MVVGNTKRGESPAPFGGLGNKYIIIQKGVLQVIEKNFWFITLCALLIISSYTGLNIFLRIAIGANAVIILADVIKQIRGFRNGRNETEN